MLLFQFAEAEELLRQDDWALLREWVATPPGARRVIADLQRPGALTAGLNWYRANLHPRRELDPPRALPAGHRADTLGVWSTGDAYLIEARHDGSGRARRRTGATSASRARATGCSSTQPDAVSALLMKLPVLSAVSNCAPRSPRASSRPSR